MDKQREMFEAWYSKYCDPGFADWFKRDAFDSNEYDMSHTQTAWDAWQAALASQWQPIETAPKDGERILGWCQVEADVVYWRRVNGEHRWMSDAAVDFGGHETPTHWMPLPPDPAK